MSTSRPASAAILAELETVCAGPVFAKAPGAARLLRFLVERELAGGAVQLRETYIGSALYGRDRDYDPKIDGIVRVNANRLRTRLEEHYWRYPASRVQFVLQRGSYVPVYRLAAEEPQGPPVGLMVAEPDDRLEALVELTKRAPSPARAKPRWPWVAAGAVGMCLAMMLAVWASKEWGRGAEFVWTSRPLTRFAGAQEFPAFSPDGQRVAFVWSGGGQAGSHIYLVDLNGGMPERLTAGVEDESRPAWSPDGASMAYLRLLGEGRKLIVVRNVATKAERTVAAIEGRSLWLCALPKLAWSRDERTLFTSATPAEGEAPPSENCGLIALDVGSGARRSLTHPGSGALGDLEAAVSPDGSRVAFVREFNYISSDLFSVPANGGSALRLTSDDKGVLGFSWDAGGRLLVSSRRADGEPRLWRMPLAGGTPEQMTDGSVGPWFPATTPTGDEIVFTVFRSVTKVWRQTAAGREELVGYGSSNSKPQLSPDGKEVLYTGEHSGSLDLWIVEAASGQTRQLTHMGSYPALGARWSPDGRRIVFECSDQQRTGICLIAANGVGGVRRLPAGTASQIQPSWSRDGQFLYYAADGTGRWEIYREPMAGGAAVRVTYDGGMRALESWDGRYVYVHRGEPRGGLLRLPTASVGRGPMAEERTARLPVPASLESWAVGREGVLVLEARGGKELNTVVLYRAESRQPEMLYQVSGVLRDGAFSVGDDERSICYMTEEARTGELELLERRRRP